MWNQFQIFTAQIFSKYWHCYQIFLDMLFLLYEDTLGCFENEMEKNGKTFSFKHHNVYFLCCCLHFV